MPLDDLDQLSNSDLIRRCLNQDSDAWKVFVDRHRESLRCTTWSLLGEKRFDRHAVEDIAQMVWIAQLVKQHDLLRRYQQARGSFTTYLRTVAKRVIERLYRSTGRRRLHEVPLDGHDQSDPGANNGLAEAQFAEYQESLSAQEKRFLHERVLREAHEDEKPQISAGNARVLKHRMKRKGFSHETYAEEQKPQSEFVPPAILSASGGSLGRSVATWRRAPGRASGGFVAGAGQGAAECHLSGCDR